MCDSIRQMISFNQFLFAMPIPQTFEHEGASWYTVKNGEGGRIGGAVVWGGRLGGVPRRMQLGRLASMVQCAWCSRKNVVVIECNSMVGAGVAASTMQNPDGLHPADLFDASHI